MQGWAGSGGAEKYICLYIMLKQLDIVIRMAHDPRMEEGVRSEVRKYRFLGGEMTQEQLAARVGVSRQTIIAIEKGKYNPSVGLAIRIARVFAVPVEAIFGFADDERVWDD